MNEVSCRAVQCFLPALEARHIAPSRLVEGLGVSLDHLRDPGKRIDWETNVELVQRASELLGDDAPRQIAEFTLDSAPVRVFRLLGPFVSDTSHLYRMACRWVGPSFFTHIQYHCRDLPDGRLEIEIELPEGYRGCAEFFEATRFSFVVLPRLIGREDAFVDAEVASHRARFVVYPPRRASPFGWIRRITGLPGAVKAAYEELATQQLHLNRALRDAREARVELETRDEQLAMLDRLGNEVATQLGSEKLPDEILAFLVRRFGWRGASLWMRTPEDRSLLFFGRVGETSGEASRSYPLEVGSERVGRLEVWNGPKHGDERDRDLLEKLLPWIATSVLNARVAASLREPGAHSGLRWASKSGRDLFLILDNSAQILYAGPRPEDLLGYGQADLAQMDVTELVHPDDWPRLVRDFEALSSHSSSAVYSSARLQLRDGSWCRMEGVAIKVLSEGGADVYLVSCGDAGEERSATH